MPDPDDDRPDPADLFLRAAELHDEAAVLVRETRRLLGLLRANRVETHELLAHWHVNPPRAAAAGGTDRGHRGGPTSERPRVLRDLPPVLAPDVPAADQGGLGGEEHLAVVQAGGVPHRRHQARLASTRSTGV